MNDSRLVYRKITRREAKIMCLDALSAQADLILDAGFIDENGKPINFDDKSIMYLNEEIDKLCYELEKRAKKLKLK